jgi:GxxExxY protein
MTTNPSDARKPFSHEGYALMGAAFEVHKILGGGLLEDIYQEAMEIELGLHSIPFVSKGILATFYKNIRLKKHYEPDLLVYQQIVVELKSVRELIPEHEAQLMNYMRLTRKPVGYLLNFGPITKIEWKRFVLSEYLQPYASNIQHISEH